MRLALFLLAGLGTAAGAQPSASWSPVEPALGVSAPLRDGFGPAWALETGLSVRLAASAYGGWARATIRTLSAEPRDVAAPAFDLTLPSVGWGPEVAVGPARLSAGPEVGVARFQFDDDEGGNLQNETELTVGAWVGAAVPLAWGARLWVEGTATRVALAEPVTLASVGGGLAVRLDAPRWLQRVLR